MNSPVVCLDTLITCTDSAVRDDSTVTACCCCYLTGLGLATGRVFLIQAAMADQPVGQQKPGLSEEMLKVIHGHGDQGEKLEKYQESLQRWWKHYSSRKNDEEDMVADSLLYDERCHLPRTTPGPKPLPEPEVTAAAQPQTADGSGAGAAAAAAAAAAGVNGAVAATYR